MLELKKTLIIRVATPRFVIHSSTRLGILIIRWSMSPWGIAFQVTCTSWQRSARLYGGWRSHQIVMIVQNSPTLWHSILLEKWVQKSPKIKQDISLFYVSYVTFGGHVASNGNWGLSLSPRQLLTFAQLSCIPKQNLIFH